MTIRSFVRRSGRITPSQRHALEALQARFALPDCLEEPLDDEAQLDLDALFQRQAPRHLEIGFGMGEALLQVAGSHPDKDYLGIEVYPPGVGRVLSEMEKQELNNIRVWATDAVEVLARRLPEASLDAIAIFFPDPWPKKKHHKRRLIQAPFVKLLARCLKPQGRLFLATDWAEYAQQMLEVMDADDRFINQAGQGNFMPRPEERPLTKFERRGQRLGHDIFDLIYQRVD